MKIAVIGGSIAGCAIAAQLLADGQDVTVFERSSSSHTARGAGIILTESLVQECIELNLFDSKIPRFPVKDRSFNIKNEEIKLDSHSREIWRQVGADIVALNWNDIYQNLRKRIPDECYHGGEEVYAIHEANNVCTIETSQSKGKKYEFDLVIAADGINSTIRKQIFPDVACKYSGYVAWRGTTNHPDFIKEKIFDAHIPYYVFSQGHLLAYMIPASDKGKTSGKLINWLLYEVHAAASLDKLLVDKDGKQHAVSLPPGHLSEQHIDHLHKVAQQVLPVKLANMVCQTAVPFLQAIFDLQVSQYNKGRVCFIADAATLARPHSASGIWKALKDSISLAKALQKTTDLPKALSAWSESQLVLARQQAALSQRMGEALVTDSPDWHKMNQEVTEKWWDSVIRGESWYLTSNPAPRARL